MVDIKGMINARTRNNKKAKVYELTTDYKYTGLMEYPRPQMVRDSYINLNGEWDLRISSEYGSTIYDGKIIVPFSPEARLSGVGHVLLPNQTLLYEKDIIVVGDVTGKGNVSSVDALFALRYSSGLYLLQSPYAYAADVNNDRKVNSADALMILKYSAGLISSFD